MIEFKKDDEICVINVEPLKGNTIAPKLQLNEVRKVVKIVLDKDGNQHLDLGLKSQYNYIRSYETREELPNGDSIHWVHPSRVILV